EVLILVFVDRDQGRGSCPGRRSDLPQGADRAALHDPVFILERSDQDRDGCLALRTDAPLQGDRRLLSVFHVAAAELLEPDAQGPAPIRWLFLPARAGQCEGSSQEKDRWPAERLLMSHRIPFPVKHGVYLPEGGANGIPAPAPLRAAGVAGR